MCVFALRLRPDPALLEEHALIADGQRGVTEAAASARAVIGVGVDVDEAGRDDLAAGVDDARGAGVSNKLQVATYYRVR